MKKLPQRTDGPTRHCALVTGAAAGIGLCFCRELARRGCDLVMADRAEDTLGKEARALQHNFPDLRILPLAIDLTVADVTERIGNFCTLNGVEPDILVNNAGIFSFRPVADTPRRTIDTFVDLHVRAVTMLSQWFVGQRMPHRCGWLLNMSSMSCWMPMPGLAMYAATKAYIRVFSRSLALEAADSGISVTVACPGGIATTLFGLPPHLMRLAVATGAVERPEKFVRRALDCMFRGRRQYINGLLNKLSIPAVALTPSRLRMAVKHRLLDRGITR